MSQATESPKSLSPCSRCFALYTRRSGQDVLQAMAKTKDLLEKSGAEVVDIQALLDGKKAEALLSFGGDGSLLHAARLTAPLHIPVLGVNFGHVGYMCAVKEEDLELAVNLIVEGKYAIEKRTMLNCSVFHGGERVWQAEALNEFLIGGSSRTVSLAIRIDGYAFGYIRGDGLIVATKTGSTAYSFSAGGPVMLLDGLCLVASNAVFSSAIRSVVLPVNSTIEVVNVTHSGRPFVVADGQKDFPIDENTKIIISQSPLSALFIDLKLKSPVEILHQGFHELMIREQARDNS